MTPDSRAQLIDELDQPTLETLQAVAALREIRLRDVPAVLTKQGAYVEKAIRAGVVALDGGTLRPADSHIGSAALALLNGSDRQALHRELARRSADEFDAIRQRDLATEAGQDAELALVLERAAMKAERAGRVDLAVEFWSRSAGRSPHGCADRTDRELRLAAEEHRNGKFHLAAGIIEALNWDHLTGPQAERAIDLLTASVYRSHGLAAVRFRGQRLVESLPAGHPHREILSLYLSGLGEDFGEVQHQLEQALPRLRSERYSVAFRHSNIAKLLYAKVNTGAGLDAALLEDLERLQRQLPDILLEDTVEARIAMYAYTVDDVATSRRALAALLVESEVQGDAGFRQILLVHAAQVDILMGRFSSAADRLSLAESLAPQLAAAPASVRARGLLALELGHDDELSRIIGRVPETGVAPLGHFTRVALRGILLARSGDAPEAIRHLEDALSTAEKLGIKEPGRRLWIDVDLARASIQLGDPDRARSLAKNLHEIAERTGRALPLLQAQRIDAWLASGSEPPEAILERALALLVSSETMEWLPERARLTTEVLRLLRDVPVDEAHRTTVTRAAHSILTLLEESATRSALAAELTRWEQSRVSSLTRSERRVAELITQGVSNKEAGEILRLSPRTIESHLRSVFLKLGISSRSQLIAQFSPVMGARAV